MMPGNSLAALDETDIETLLTFVLYMADRTEREQDGAAQTQTVTIGGKTYRKVTAFSTPI